MLVLYSCSTHLLLNIVTYDNNQAVRFHFAVRDLRGGLNLEGKVGYLDNNGRT